jgi:SM-20-related protein
MVNQRGSILISSTLLLLGARFVASFAFATYRRSTAHHRHRHRGGSPASASASPSLPPSAIEALSARGYVVVPDFLPRSLVDELRRDVVALRSASPSPFRRARIGQDRTNELNEDVRVAETCFLGRSRRELPTSSAKSSAGGLEGSVRDRPGGLYDLIDGLRQSLDDVVVGGTAPGGRLDGSLDELLYAYYPRGGYYRRHRDSVPNSASALRRYSLLLYLNEEGWDPEADGGRLRMHLDGGGDEIPPGADPDYVDVDPIGGTLVLFRSESVPHEVLDTRAERYAIVGWYNRGVTAADVATLGGAAVGGIGGGVGVARAAMLAVAMALVTFGVASIVAGG